MTGSAEELVRICPRCLQGDVSTYRLRSTDELVQVCDECEALWPHGADIGIAAFAYLVPYSQANGGTGLWDELVEATRPLRDLVPPRDLHAHVRPDTRLTDRALFDQGPPEQGPPEQGATERGATEIPVPSTSGRLELADQRRQTIKGVARSRHEAGRENVTRG